ncbi:pyridoxamine 5'-phosphate oxidase family protein [Saccharothrix sp. HUAS TT1]|uniref:pyridoxamine 5'-phosphate oxidase family protein n=1 Tax=unclassified Saccharothrix TaxID=2593673 RepID=UPI00345C342C
MSAAHEGEQAVQRKAGEGRPGWGSPMFDGEIPDGFAEYMRAQRLIAIGGQDDRGAVWCTVLDGDPGFVDALDDRTIDIHALPPPGDPVREVFGSGPGKDIGMVVMSPETQRRVKVSGTARREGGKLVLRTEQVLGNCPKYLQGREVVGVAPAVEPSAHRGRELTAYQRELVESADTFFIASSAPGHGADANHRGGLPGFVTVTGPRSLTWPDYVGNSFYMTLGNMELQPRCGLVFRDWETGGTVQLTGTGRVNWSREPAERFPGALRTIDFEVEEVVQVDNATRLRWKLFGYSRFNPPAPER